MCSCRCRCRLSQRLQGWWSCVAWDAPGAGSPIPTLRLGGAGARRVHPISGLRWGNAVLTRSIEWSPYNDRLGGLAMLPEHRVLLEDEPCPVADQMLGEMYRASAH